MDRRARGWMDDGEDRGAGGELWTIEEDEWWSFVKSVERYTRDFVSSSVPFAFFVIPKMYWTLHTLIPPTTAPSSTVVATALSSVSSPWCRSWCYIYNEYIRWTSENWGCYLQKEVPCFGALDTVITLIRRGAGVGALQVSKPTSGRMLRTAEFNTNFFSSWNLDLNLNNFVLSSPLLSLLSSLLSFVLVNTC